MAVRIGTKAVVLADPDRSEALADEGRRSVARFTWDAAAAALEEHLARSLADPATYRAGPGPDGLSEDWTVEDLLRATQPDAPSLPPALDHRVGEPGPPHRPASPIGSISSVPDRGDQG